MLSNQPRETISGFSQHDTYFKLEGGFNGLIVQTIKYLIPAFGQMQ